MLIPLAGSITALFFIFSDVIKGMDLVYIYWGSLLEKITVFLPWTAWPSATLVNMSVAFLLDNYNR